MLRDFWYIGCAASRLRSRPRSSRVLDRDLVLFRDFNLPDRVRVEFWKPFHLIVLMHFVATGDRTCRLEWLVTKLVVGQRASWTDKPQRRIVSVRT